MKTKPVQKLISVVIDDEKHSIDLMSALVRKTGLAEVVATAYDVRSGIEAIRQHKPDLVFLDIDMPDKTGFDLVKQLPLLNLSPGIIFVTGYDSFAIEAIRYSAFDYLLKPVIEAELRSSIERFIKHKVINDYKARVDVLIQKLDCQRLRFNTRSGFFYINAEDMLFLQAEGAYTDIMCTDDKIKTVSLGLGIIEPMLPAGKFIRISRSIIVNQDYISEVTRHKKCCYLKYNSQTIELPVSGRYLKEMLMKA